MAMNRLTRVFRRQTPVAEIIEDNNNQEWLDREAHRESGVVEGYNSIRIRQPNVELITVKRKQETSEDDEQQDTLASDYRPYSATGSFRTILTRASDGKLVWVQRPIRDSVVSPIDSARSSHFGLTLKTMSAQSFSGYNRRAQRGTMTSIMSIEDSTIAEEHTEEQRRHSRRDGSSATADTAATASAASGNIQIGHVEEIDEDGYSSQYSASEYGGNNENFSEGEDGLLDEFERNQGTRRDRSSSKFFDSRGLPQNLPTRISAAYFAKASTDSWGQYDKPRVRAREAYHAPSGSTTRLWMKRLIRCCTYLVAICSIIIPAAFLILGIAVVCSNDKSVSSGWSVMTSLVNVCAAIWPVALATVVAQCLKAWITFKAHRSQSRLSASSGPGRQSFSSYRLEVVCLLLVLAWCLSPLGSQALMHVYGFRSEVQTDNADVWYVDRTGYNQVWSFNATNNMSTSSRSELVQIIGEKYLGTMSPNNMELGLSGLAAVYSHPQLASSHSNDSMSGLEDGDSYPADLLYRNALFDSGLDAPVGNVSGSLTFSMTTSYFKLSCGNWNLTTGRLDNRTSPSQMSYSSSETLGMNMTSGRDDVTDAPAGTVSFVSLNRASSVSPVELARRPMVAMLSAAGRPSEYSSITCDYRQQFYEIPVMCNQSNGTGVASCSQSGDATLIPSSRGFSGTQLGDFAQDFVWTGNLPTTSKEATATEKYIQIGGPVNPAALLANLDDSGSGSLNLSATVSPEQFAQRFEHLLNTWVSLGYCPQCTSKVLAGNNTELAASLQPYYRRATATTTQPGDQTFDLNWAWTGVFMTLAIVILLAGVTGVAVESITAGSKRGRGRGARKRDLFELQLPKTNSTVHGGLRSGQWAEGVMRDMEDAANAGWTRGW